MTRLQKSLVSVHMKILGNYVRTQQLFIIELRSVYYRLNQRQSR